MTLKGLDELYRNSPGAYLELLQFMTREFETNCRKFEEHLSKNDVILFAQLKHKVFSTLNTLENKELMGYLEELKAEMLGGKLAEPGKRVDELKRQFKLIGYELERKIAEIEASLKQ